MLRRLLTAALLVMARPDLEAGEVANPRLAERYEKLLAQHPDSPTALDRLWKMAQDGDATDDLLKTYAARQTTFSGALVYGYLLERAHRLEEAQQAFRQAASLDAKSPLPHAALAHLLADPATAAAEWEIAAQLDPKVETLLALGNAWQSAHEPEKAAAAWERAAALDSGNAALHAQLAANYEQNHLPEQALKQYQLLAASGEPSQRVPAAQSAARLLQSLDRLPEAERVLEQALALLAPGNWQRRPVQAQLVQMVQRSGRLAALESRWAEAVKAAPNDLGAYWKLADLYEELGNSAQERGWLEKMATLAPESDDVQRRLARAQRAAGDARAAAKTLDALQQTHGGESDFIFERAELDLQLDQPGAAVARLEQLWQSHPDDEALQRRVLDFYRRARLRQPWEQHLRAEAAKDGNGAAGILALARFLFAEQRPAEAQAALLKLVRASDTPAEQAEAWAQIAAELKEQNALAPAVQAYREAARLQPDAAARRTALAEALLAHGQLAEARGEMLAAWKLDPSEANDQKLFQILQPRRPSAPLALGDDPDPSSTGEDAAGREARHGFETFRAAILAQAAENPSVDTLLRASRWLLWSRRWREALVLAQRALPLAEDPIPVRKQILHIASALPDRRLAQEQLLALAQQDAKNASDWQRQLGQAQMENGDQEAALKTFSDLAAASPKDPAVLGSLALAQQQADRWSDALATWQRAFALTPANRRKEAMQPLLRAMEHLGLFQKGAELLLSLADAQSDAATREAAFEDALTFCQQHALLPWLAGQLETRRRRDPSDASLLRALAQLQQASGDAESALQLITQAAAQTPDDPALLREVVHAAAELERPEVAIAQQRRLVQLGSQTDPAEWEALAQNEEAAGEISSAHATWQQVAAQFPRDTEALKKCAAFFTRWQDADSAREALRRVRVLAPADWEALLALARQASPAEAISCYQQILQRSRPAGTSDSLTFPGLATRDWQYWQSMYFRALQLRNGRADGPLAQQFQELWQFGGKLPSGEAAARLAAIEAYAILLRQQGNDAALQDWQRRWDAMPATAESLFAHYFAGDKMGTGQVLRALMTARPADGQLRQAYVYLSLQMGNFAELARWRQAPERDASDRDLFLVAIARFAASAPRDEKWLAELFPFETTDAFTAWQAASLLAGEGRLEAAIWLGQRVFHKVPAQRTTTGLLLAQWLTTANRVDDARAVLKSAVETAGSTLDDPIYEVLRRCVLLLPLEQRTAFAQSYLQRWRSSPLHTANARLLFAALDHSRTDLQSAVASLLRLAPTPLRGGDDLQVAAELRYWSYLENTGAQLQAWHLDRAARELWQQSLASPAETALRSTQTPEIIHELRLRMLVAQIAAAAPGERIRMIHDFSASASAKEIATLAIFLDSAGCSEAAQSVYRTVWPRDPANRQLLNGLVSTSRTIGDLDPACEALREAFQSLLAGPPQPDYSREEAVATATIFRENNRRGEARTIMETARNLMPNDPFLLERSANFFAEDGQDELAEPLYRTLLSLRKDNEAARIGLQKILRHEGRETEASALEPTLTIVRASEPEERAQQAISTAKAMKMAGKNQDAQGRLWSTLAMEARPEFRYDLASALLELLPEGDARRPLLRAQLRAIITLAPAGPESYRARRNSVDPWENRAHQYYDRMTGEDLQSVQEDWSAGAGNLQAGLALLRFYSEDKSAALATIGRSLSARANELSQRQLEESVDALNRGGEDQLARSLREGTRLAALPSFDEVRQREKKGDHAGARQLLDQLAARSVFDESLFAALAGQYEQLHESAEARRYWEQEIATDVPARKSTSWLGYAACLAAQHDPAARPILRRAYTNRGNTHFEMVFQALPATASLAEAAAAISDLALSPAQERAYWRGLLQHWQEQQNFMGVVTLALAKRELFFNHAASLQTVRMAAAKTNRQAEVLAWLEPLAAPASVDFPWLLALIAGMQADWAAVDSAHAATHLERALVQTPQNFSLVKKLCDLYIATGEKEKARKALAAFAAQTRNVKEKQAAEQQQKAL